MPEEQENTKVEEFMEIGGSPIPGVTLRQILRGHSENINRIAWSPDGRYLASPSDDTTIRIWDIEKSTTPIIINSPQKRNQCLSWSPDSKRLALGWEENSIRIWEFDNDNKILLPTSFSKQDFLTDISWSPNGQFLTTTAYPAETIDLLDTRSRRLLMSYDNYDTFINSVEWSRDGKFIATGDEEGGLKIWHTGVKDLYHKIDTSSKSSILHIAWSPNGKKILSCGLSSTIQIWDLESEKQDNALEGHVTAVAYLSFSADGHLLASKAWGEKGDVRLWRTDTWQTVAILTELASHYTRPSIAFHPILPILATLGQKDTIIRIWDIDQKVLLGNPPTIGSTHFRRLCSEKVAPTGQLK